MYNNKWQKNVGKWSLLYFLPSAYVSNKVGSTTLNPMHIWFYLLFGQSQVGRRIESAATLYLFENRKTVVDEIKRLRKNVQRLDNFFVWKVENIKSLTKFATFCIDHMFLAFISHRKVSRPGRADVSQLANCNQSWSQTGRVLCIFTGMGRIKMEGGFSKCCNTWHR